MTEKDLAILSMLSGAANSSLTLPEFALWLAGFTQAEFLLTRLGPDVAYSSCLN